MPLSKRRLNILAKERKQVFAPIREFDDGTEHPVVLMECSHTKEVEWSDGRTWRTLMCPCELSWKWEKFGTPPRRTMVMTGNAVDCPAQENAREVVRKEVREKNHEQWSQLSLADTVLDVWKKHCEGEYLGEHNVGTLYVQDLERLLGTSPDTLDIHIGEGKNAQGEVVSPPHVEHLSFPSKTILSAVSELRKRKLIDLNGMILVPHVEHFRFPDQLHHQCAYWIEEAIGWPNGDAGDCFMYELYKKISEKTGWRSCEDVFGKANTPKLTDAWAKHTKKWFGLLDWRLVFSETANKAEILHEISIPTWIGWLQQISAEIEGVTEG